MEQEIKILTTNKSLGQKQVVLDCKVLAESGKEIGKVLSISAKPILISCECLTGQMTIAGKTNFKIVYLTENADIVCANNIVDFQEVFESDFITATSNGNVELKVVDVTTPSVKVNEIKVASIIDIIASASINSECPIAQIEGAIFTKKSVTEITEQKCTFDDTFDLETDIKIADNLKTVVSVDNDISVKESYSGANFVVVSGEVFCNILYIKDDNTLASYKEAINFKQEISVSNVTADSIIVAKAIPLDYLAKVVVSQENGYNLVRMELPITNKGVVYENTIIDHIEDAYSCEQLLDFEYGEYEKLQSIVVSSFSDNVKGQLTLPATEDIKYYNLLGFCAIGTEVSNSFATDDKLTVEGVISGTLFYKGEQSEDIMSIIAEVPFAINNTNTDFEGVKNFNVNIGITDWDMTIRAGSEVDIIVSLNAYVFGYENGNVQIVKSINEVGARPNSDCAIEIVVARDGQMLWELGKQMGVPIEQILLQNKGITEPLEGGQKIIMYHPLNR